jgi:hypothetical protein
MVFVSWKPVTKLGGLAKKVGTDLDGIDCRDRHAYLEPLERYIQNKWL